MIHARFAYAYKESRIECMLLRVIDQTPENPTRPGDHGGKWSCHIKGFYLSLIPTQYQLSFFFSWYPFRFILPPNWFVPRSWVYLEIGAFRSGFTTKPGAIDTKDLRSRSPGMYRMFRRNAGHRLHWRSGRDWDSGTWSVSHGHRQMPRPSMFFRIRRPAPSADAYIIDPDYPVEPYF